jgi:hypothetical protein
MESSDRPERRRAVRIPERCRVAYRVIREGAAAPKLEAGQTLNLSASGLCLVSPGPIERDAHLALQLSLEGHTEPVMAVGRVVWCDEARAEENDAPPEGRYRVGVCFTWLREEDRRALAVISDYVQGRVGDSP